MARVFIVEDEALIVLELQDRLIQLGHEVCGHAARADTALHEIPRMNPDLILLDVNLGPGPDGVELLRQLRTHRDFSVLFITAYATTEIQQRLGGLPCLVKPFRSEELKLMVDRALHQTPAC